MTQRRVASHAHGEAPVRRYHTFISDNIRWEGFEHREGDVVVSTPPKAGTTWTQMLCLSLVLGTPDLPEPLSIASPWLDQLTSPLPEVVARLAAQTHRRVIKTHTPLDGLPLDDRVTYVCVGRDPREMGASWAGHVENSDIDTVVRVRAEAVGLDDLAGLDLPPMAPEDPLERFWWWTSEPRGNAPGTTLPGICEHATVMWQHRLDPNVVLVHYGDLRSDLPAEVTRLAERLQVDVDAGTIERICAASTFEAMRATPERFTPNAGIGLFKDLGQFFRGDSAEAWQALLGADDIARYEAVVAALVSPDVAAWLHGGRHVADPDAGRPTPERSER